MNKLYNTKLDIVIRLKFFANIDFYFSKPQIKFLSHILTSIIKSSIDNVINLPSSLNIKITFLADRWFFNFNLMKHINDKDHWVKVNSDAKFLCYDKKEKREIYKKLLTLTQGNILIDLVQLKLYLKSKKTNGFNLEKTKVKNLYNLVCFTCNWIVIIIANYIKNYGHLHFI